MQLRIWPKSKIGKSVAVIALGILLLPLFYSRLTCNQRAVQVRGSIGTRPEAEPQEHDLLSIASYNIAHGRGLAESNLSGGNEAERLDRLNKIAELLRQVDADIVVLNEVDFDSSWSYSINQAEYLAKKAGYPIWVEQRNMDFRIAFWNWAFGNAVLSKYPIQEAQLVQLPGHSLFETIVLGQKQAIACEVAHPHGSLQVIGAHLSQRSEEVRVASTKLILQRTQNSPIPTVFAGDLNSSPTGFNESAQDSSGENAIDLLDQSSQFHRWSQTNSSDPSHCTFSSNDPKVVIDWIFIPRTWQFEQFQINAQQLSDHRLIHAQIQTQ